METQKILISDIVRNEDDLQLRVSFDSDHIDAMTEALREGAILPPITVFKAADGLYHVADGWHRLYAHMAADKDTINAFVHEGDFNDAFKWALQANAEHLGLRRTNADKRNAVLKAILHYPKMSGVKIAEMCKVTRQCVDKIKREIDGAKEGGGATVASVKHPSSGGVNDQMDFFADIAGTVISVEKAMSMILNHSVFINDDIPLEKRLETVRAIRAKLDEQRQELKSLEEKLTQQAA